MHACTYTHREFDRPHICTHLLNHKHLENLLLKTYKIILGVNLDTYGAVAMYSIGYSTVLIFRENVLTNTPEYPLGTKLFHGLLFYSFVVMIWKQILFSYLFKSDS